MFHVSPIFKFVVASAVPSSGSRTPVILLAVGGPVSYRPRAAGPRGADPAAALHPNLPVGDGWGGFRYSAVAGALATSEWMSWLLSTPKGREAFKQPNTPASLFD